jgi:molybdate transport system substrate-binding protein
MPGRRSISVPRASWGHSLHDARADVFASADQAQMDDAKKADTIAAQDRVFARNRLVLIAPKSNPANVTGVKDLAADDRLELVTAQPNLPEVSAADLRP